MTKLIVNDIDSMSIVMALTGKPVPDFLLASTDDQQVNLASLKGISVVYAYPRISPPDQPSIDGWDDIPGAKGCTIQSRGFATNYGVIIGAGASHVYGLSTQLTGVQKEAVERLHLPFHLLSDHQMDVAHHLGLPRFNVGQLTLLSRITLVIEEGIIKKVFFPVHNAAKNAALVAKYLMTEQSSSS